MKKVKTIAYTAVIAALAWPFADLLLDRVPFADDPKLVVAGGVMIVINVLAMSWAMVPIEELFRRPFAKPKMKVFTERLEHVLARFLVAVFAASLFAEEWTTLYNKVDPTFYVPWALWWRWWQPVFLVTWAAGILVGRLFPPVLAATVRPRANRR